MKIENVHSKDYRIYLYDIFIDKVDLFAYVSEFLKKLQKKLSLCGLYRVVISKKKIGLFLQLIHLEDSIYHNSLDLKLEMDDSLEVYFKTEDYFLIQGIPSVRYSDGMFYALVGDDFDCVMEKIEFGEFVFGNDVMNIFNKGYIVI